MSTNNCNDYRYNFINESLTKLLDPEDKILCIGNPECVSLDRANFQSNVTVIDNVETFESLKMYDYDLIVFSNLVAYDGFAGLRSNLNRYYHFLALKGTMVLTFEIARKGDSKPGLVNCDEFIDLIDNYTNMEIFTYELFAGEESDVKSYLTAVLKTV